MDYINKKDLLETINEVYECKYFKCKFKPVQDIYNMIVNRIDKAQVINLNDVVHCKECKYWKYIGYDHVLEVNFGACHCEHWAGNSEYPETDAVDFCSYGQREKDE